MSTEIERKFLVDSSKLGDLPTGYAIKQGYIQTDGSATVRARVMGDKAYITLKGKTINISRSEFEYPIPVSDAEQILAELCHGMVVEKTRYLIKHASHTWELDIFEGLNRGLIVAEIELDAEDEHFELPDWVTNEVTGDGKYYNASLLHFPFTTWS